MAIKKISANLLGNNAVTAASIAGGAISAADIADNSITAAKISTSTFAIDSLTVNTSDLVVDTANNRVGIGTSSPDQTLTVVGSTAIAGKFLGEGGPYGLVIGGNDSGFGYIGEISTGQYDLVIDTSGNVGIGKTNPAYVLDVTDTTGNAYISIARGTQSQGEVGVKLEGGTGGGDWYMYQDTSSNDLRFYQGSDKVTFDTSGNVGIGTSSPTAFGGYITVQTDATTGGLFDIKVGGIRTANFQASASNALIDVKTAIPLIFNTDSTERMRITSTGSVGIGYNVTSPVTTLEVSNTTNSQKLLALFESQTAGRAVALGVTETGVGGNAAIYGTSTNGSDTTQDLYLNPDGGSVIIGKRPVGSLDAKITADGNAAATTFRMSYDYGNATLGNRGANLDFQIGNNSGSATKITTNYWPNGNGDINITAYGRTSPHLYLKASTTDKVDSLGIGTSNPNAQLHIDATGTHNNSGDAHVNISKNSSNDWSLALNAGNDDYGLITAGYGSNALYVYDYNASAVKFRVSYTGVISAANTTVQSISDERLKENIVDANSQWNDIKGLRFRNFNWVDNKYGDKTYLGLIAQEVEPICPNLIEIDAQPKKDIDEGVPDPEYKTVNYSIVWMKSVKALQEAMERIEQLEARLEEAGL